MFRWLPFILLMLAGVNCDLQDSGGNQAGQNSAEQVDQANKPYSVQVAAFSDHDNAQSLVERLRGSGLSAFIAAPDSSQHFHRTRVGPFASEEEALKTLASVKEMGFNEAFIKIDSAAVLIREAEKKEEAKKDDLARVKAHYLTLKSGTVEDGERMPDVYGKGELFTRRITLSGQCSHPRWSPNGREIAFFKKEQGVSGIYTIGSGGGPVSRVIESTENFEVLPQFEWDPLGGQFAFTANVIDENWEKVMTLNAVSKSGQRVIRILNQRNVPFTINSLSWSPNSYMLAFNLDYGKVDPALDRIQRVMIANLNNLEPSYPDRNRTIHGKHIESTSLLEQTNWVAGWANSTKLIFLASNADAHERPADGGYEIWQFDAIAKKRQVLREGAVVKPFRSIALLGGQERLIYSGSSGKYVTCLDYFTGKELRLLDSPNVSSLSTVHVNDLNQALFIVDGYLWVNNPEEVISITELENHPTDFTLSPLAERICYVQDGALMVSRVKQADALQSH
jgi:hypothetical protein